MNRVKLIIFLQICLLVSNFSDIENENDKCDVCRLKCFLMKNDKGNNIDLKKLLNDYGVSNFEDVRLLKLYDQFLSGVISQDDFLYELAYIY